jgi:nuclear RNA export factor
VAQVAHVRRLTGLNEQFARQCLAESGWDVGAALASFEAVKGSIPPQAYV